MLIHPFVLFIDNREEWAFGISLKALAIDLPVKLKRFLSVECDLKAARLAKAFTFDLGSVLLMIERAFDIIALISLHGSSPFPIGINSPIIDHRLEEFIGISASSEDLAHFLIQNLKLRTVLDQFTMLFKYVVVIAKIAHQSVLPESKSIVQYGTAHLQKCVENNDHLLFNLF